MVEFARWGRGVWFVSGVGKYVGSGMIVGWHSFTPAERPRPVALGDKPLVVRLTKREQRKRRAK